LYALSERAEVLIFLPFSVDGHRGNAASVADRQRAAGKRVDFACPFDCVSGAVRVDDGGNGMYPVVSLDFDLVLLHSFSPKNSGASAVVRLKSRHAGHFQP